MWKLIFSTATNKGTGCNREPQDGEFSRDLPPSECAWFNVYPERYMWNGTGIEEIPGYMEAEQLKQAKQEQEILIRNQYLQDSEAPVEVLGITWNGGQDSAGYIQGAVSLAQALGESSVFITDINNVKHELSFVNALTVSAMIGKAFRTAFFIKQEALVQLCV